jgi:hypothetical protein
MKIIVTLGVQTDTEYTESSRCEIEVTEDTTISEALELAKKNSAPMAPASLQRHLERHMYLMHPDTLERLDDSKTIRDYSLKDGDIVRLMSAAR